MKIVDVKTFMVGVLPIQDWSFVKLMTDEGIEGIGEASVPFASPTAALMLEDMARDVLIGADPHKIEKIWTLLYCGRNCEHPDLTRLGIISALEMACWDIIGKAANQPVYNLLGGKFHDKVRSYRYLGLLDGSVRDVWRDPKANAEKAVEYVENGFTAIKIDPVQAFIGIGALGPRELSLEILRTTEAVVKSIREAVGDRCDICIGTHGQMTTHAAISLAKRLEDYHPLWFEEPIRGENTDEMARVAHATSIPIATGERLSTKWEFGDLLEKQAASIIQLCVSKLGGLLEAKKIAGMSEVHYAQIAPYGGALGPVALAASVQLDTCSPNFLIQEANELTPPALQTPTNHIFSELINDGLKLENGYIIPPDKPGLGIDFNEKVAAKYPPHTRLTTNWHWKDWLGPDTAITL